MELDAKPAQVGALDVQIQILVLDVLALQLF